MGEVTSMTCPYGAFSIWKTPSNSNQGCHSTYNNSKVEAPYTTSCLKLKFKVVFFETVLKLEILHNTT